MQVRSLTISDRWWNREGQSKFHLWFARSEPDTCWIWTGPLNSRDRPTLAVVLADGRTRSVDAIQLAVVLSGRTLFPGVHVHHTCETKLCVNPDHLVALSPSEHAAAHHELALADRPPELSDHAWLMREYRTRDRSIRSIARELECSRTSVRTALADLHIPQKG